MLIIIAKNSNTNYDASWSDTHEIPSGGSDGNILVKDGATPYNSTWTNTPQQMGSIAHINTGNTADKTYQPGEYLVWNGQLYKVGDSAIAEGVTLNAASGGNIENTSVGTELLLKSRIK